jgi:predicted DNA-binding WGR domain protein
MRCGKLPLMPPKRLKAAAGSAPITQLSLFAEEANLARVYPEENMWRFYRMEVWPDLLGGALLMRQWGRIGTEGRRRLDPYPDVGAALNALAAIERAKRKRGYIDRR